MSSPLKNWLATHDDRWSFIIFYLGAAVVLSIYLSLFWVALLMVVHFFLELAHHLINNEAKPILSSLWHVKLDIALLIFAFVIGVFAEQIIGALGLGQAARAARGAQAVTRFSIIQRSLRVVLLSVDEMGRLIAVAFKNITGKAASAAAQEEQIPQNQSSTTALSKLPWQKPEAGDWFSLGFATVCLLLLFVAPLITPHSAADVWHIIATEITP